MKSLRFLQALALLPVPAAVTACGPSTTQTSGAQTPNTSSSASASTTTTAANPPPSATTTSVAEAEPTGDPTAGSGPCRCSWETNAAAAPRVCKKGETSHNGKVCSPGKHYPYSGPIKGPLDPPELPPLVALV